MTNTYMTLCSLQRINKHLFNITSQVIDKRTKYECNKQEYKYEYLDYNQDIISTIIHLFNENIIINNYWYL